MHFLPGRYIQGREWVEGVLAVRAGQVLDGDGSHVRGDVQRLSDAYVFGEGKQPY